MRNNAEILCLAILLSLASLCVSCTPGIRLNTLGAEEAEVTGNFRVVFYGCNFFNDLETIAFLDREGDQYTFEPYAPDFKYRAKRGMAAKEALTEAESFVNCNTAFNRAQLSRIIAPNGDILGYEVRPLYHPFAYHVDDVLYTDYRLKGDKVVITIRLVPSVEKMLQDGGGRERERLK